MLHEVGRDFEESWQNLVTVTTNKFFKVVITCLTHSYAQSIIHWRVLKMFLYEFGMHSVVEDFGSIGPRPSWTY